MKKKNIKLLITVSFMCFSQTALVGQNIKSLMNRVAENETVKKTVNAIKNDSNVLKTVDALKVGIEESVKNKIEDLKNQKPAEMVLKPGAVALAPEVKNSISEVRSFTGLTSDELGIKLKTLGFLPGTDDMALGGTVYKSKTAAYVLSINMGSRNGISYVREVSKVIVLKNANLNATKVNLQKLSFQVLELKTKFSGANIASKTARGTNVNVQTPAERSSKFLPALNSYIAKKENGILIDNYTEADYSYELKITHSTLKSISTTITSIKVTDHTVDL